MSDTPNDEERAPSNPTELDDQDLDSVSGGMFRPLPFPWPYRPPTKPGHPPPFRILPVDPRTTDK